MTDAPRNEPPSPTTALDPAGAPPPAVEPPPAIQPPPPKAAAPSNRPNVFVRVIDWFWRGRAIRELTSQSIPVPARARELHRRAQVTAELARLSLEPPSPLRHGSGDAVACELYRQSVHWTLAALATARGDSPAAHGEPLRELWQRTDPALLLQSAADPDALAEVEAALVGADFVAFAELDAERQRSLAWDLRRFVDALLGTVDRPLAVLDRYRLQRLVRVSLVVLLLLFLVPGALLYKNWQDKQNDLARDRPWKASSRSEQFHGCDSPAQTCPPAKGYFFHTADEENPWVVVELAGKPSISRVEIANRTDCCAERAAPLVIEVSTDKKNWKTVAQRNDGFTTWDAKFPSTQARHVRVRALRRTILHLSGIRVFR